MRAEKLKWKYTEGINTRLDDAEEWIQWSGRQGSRNHTDGKAKGKKRTLKNEDGLRDHWNNINHILTFTL